MTRRISILLAVSTVLLTMALTVGVRLAGPADLYEKDQPKTLAYTADVLIHGRLALPRDVIYQPATKPPLYNWVAAAVVSVAGYTEWAMKSPSILGTLATAAIIFGMARRGISVKGKNCDAWLLGCLAAAIWFTFGSDVRHGSVMRLGYLARPDMLQCAFLTAAWACATIAVQRSSPKAAFWPAMGFWASVAAAALTKGPAVLLVIVFALVYAGWPLILRLLPQKRMIVAQPLGTRFKHLWLPIGAAGVALVVGLWFWQAYRTDPDHVRSVMLGAEIAGRLSDQSPEGIKKPVYYSLMWFITKAVPWGGVALLSLMVLMIARHFVGAILVSSVERRSANADDTSVAPTEAFLAFTRPWLPAGLYLVVVLLGLSLPAGKRMDYLLPAYAPAAVLAAVGLVGIARRLCLPTAFCLLLPLLVSVNLAYAYRTKFHESKSHWSDHAVAFTDRVQSIVRNETVLVLVRGKHPLTTLLGRHQGSYLTPADLKAADWLILPEQPNHAAAAVSEPLPLGFEILESRAVGRLGLYRAADAPPLEKLIELQRTIATYSADENPYHAPGTGYRDE